MLKRAIRNGPNAGHVYVVYTDDRTDESNDTDILIHSSANTGAAWSDAVQVNDAGSNSQFHGRHAVDS